MTKMLSMVALLACICNWSVADGFRMQPSRRCSSSSHHQLHTNNARHADVGAISSRSVTAAITTTSSSSSSGSISGTSSNSRSSSAHTRKVATLLLTAATNLWSFFPALADTSVSSEAAVATTAAPISTEVAAEVKAPVVLPNIDVRPIKVPFNHENVPFGDYLGKKATIVFNMKIDDPQTVLQFPTLLEIFKKYTADGLNVHAFPTEQGWFEPDDDETCRAKAKEYWGFGDEMRAVVFDKVDILGPSANPLYTALTRMLPTPNGYGRITLNYEKFLLDAEGHPVRRYPRKFTAYDMIPDIEALLAGKALPEESPAFQKAWREAKREATKSEYSFRYNYNYYTAPESMYKYNPDEDRVDGAGGTEDKDRQAADFKKANPDALFK